MTFRVAPVRERLLIEVLASSVTVTSAGWLMTTSSPAPGTAPVLQLAAVVHAPLPEPIQETVLGSTRSSSDSRRGLALLLMAQRLWIDDWRDIWVVPKRRLVRSERGGLSQ